MERQSYAFTNSIEKERSSCEIAISVHISFLKPDTNPATDLEATYGK